MKFPVMMDILKLALLMHVLHDVSCDAAPTADRTKCGAGKFWDERGQCRPCPDGTFMTEEMANEGSRYHQCARCRSPDEYTHQVAIKKCTRTEDTLIGLKDAYHLIPAMQQPGDTPTPNPTKHIPEIPKLMRKTTKKITETPNPRKKVKEIPKLTKEITKKRKDRNDSQRIYTDICQ